LGRFNTGVVCEKTVENKAAKNKSKRKCFIEFF
jgi:hypothetical protein